MLITDNSGIRWVGPTSKLWPDYQCPNLDKVPSRSLDQCKMACIQKKGCTAINYRKRKSCYLRKCSYPVPKPEWQPLEEEWQGYYLKK